MYRDVENLELVKRSVEQFKQLLGVQDIVQITNQLQPSEGTFAHEVLDIARQQKAVVVHFYWIFVASVGAIGSGDFAVSEQPRLFPSKLALINAGPTAIYIVARKANTKRPKTV
ncbi:hypothetical protein DFH08DRAFT_844898 [Mycena albidolilacea]|uniref:Uncharacterized protein n=1 Tax=Mycena albidolilacea TaxID=1033008 RepID=A0AAD7AL04_9AGAR|nr:hypothetical protein DFH08DRAFT_844898 [Mycena albidolilacea]